MEMIKWNRNVLNAVPLCGSKFFVPFDKGKNQLLETEPVPTSVCAHHLLKQKTFHLEFDRQIRINIELENKIRKLPSSRHHT